MAIDKLGLIGEQTSPLFRIMWVTNPADLVHRHFDNNISAFHIGNGLIVSVAHNLRTENPLLKSLDESLYQDEILPKLNATQKNLFNQCYIPDGKTGKRHVQITNPGYMQSISESLRSIKFDTRWFSLAERKISTPTLILQFKNDLFYNDNAFTDNFASENHFFEPTLSRYTYLVRLELLDAFYGSDIAVYKIVDTPQEIIQRIPSVKVNFSIADDNRSEIYCLQSSPAGFLGRLLNKAWIEGYMDHHQVFNDRIGGNYILEGTRYLIKGYFRFGSSGAPYLIYDADSDSFQVNAVQSEASPIQLSINNSREGNFQYVNAIASPLHLIEKDLTILIDQAGTSA
ncbi:MAG: hypothetical protein M3Q95_04190 [Bacteroidota bacterium]|nr:hypothetical protein [Bacteroidota bacterium]